MLNVGRIEEGFVLDHIPAGKSMAIYHHLQLDKLDCTVAMIMKARSNKMGTKDLLKVECDIENINMDVLAVIDHNITVNVIKDGEIVEKKELILPKEVKMYSNVKIQDALLPSNRNYHTYSFFPKEKIRYIAANTVKIKST